MSDFACDFRVVGPVQTNCFFFYDRDSGAAIVVDPGDEADKLVRYVEEKHLKVEAILLTHGHFDHIMAVEDLRKKWDVPVLASREERTVLENPQVNLSVQVGKPLSLKADRYLSDGEELELMGQKMRCILTPGHTSGGMCYYFPKQGVLFSGDTLFQESVGRTDFPTGSMSTLIRSIREKLWPLAPATKVYPGHGMMTSIESEKLYNPFVAGDGRGA